MLSLTDNPKEISGEIVMKFHHALLLVAVLLGLSISTFAQQEGEAKLVDEVIARVNTAMIMRSDYDKWQRQLLEQLRETGLKDQELEKKFTEIKPTILDGLIDEQLLIQRARDLSIDVEADINREILRVMKENGDIKTVEELEQKMREVGIDLNEYKRTLRNRLLTDRVRGQEVFGAIFRGLTEQEKRAYYDKHTEAFSIPAELSLSRILIKLDKNNEAQSQARASDIVNQARNGGIDFAALARRYSEEPLGQKGGKMEPVKMNILADEVKAALLEAKTGAIVDPVKLADGFVIFRVDERKDSKLRGFEEKEVQDEVAQRMTYERGQEEMEKYLEKLRDDAFIEVDPRYLVAANKIKPAPIKRTDFSQETEKERKKREKREKKEKEQQNKDKQARKETDNTEN
jgi:parvulin-like peptidyl-prolyl isomerase